MKTIRVNLKRSVQYDQELGTPSVDQGTINGWEMSWNPDDERFYVSKEDTYPRIFKDWRNAVYYARKH